METAFVSLICVALMVIGGMTMSQGFLTSVDNTTNNISVISQRDENIMRTNISAVSAEQTEVNTLDVCLRNTGQTKLANFDKWDIIIHYTDELDEVHVSWLPYNTDVNNLGVDEWGLEGIYIDAEGLTGEVFEPGLLNPDEEIVIHCKLSESVKEESINLVSITTPNGITVSKSFTGYVR